MLFSIVFLAVAAAFSMPQGARAGFFSVFISLFDKPKEVSVESKMVNVQTISLLQSALNSDLDLGKGGGDITVVGGSALLSENGPTGTTLEAEQEDTSSTAISVYIVRPGDTLGGIAKLFSVSANTIRWANNISGTTITPGQTLVILPVSGVRVTVAKGDTIKSFAKKYKADEGDIASFNNIADGAALTIGEVLIIPDGEIAALPVTGTSLISRNGTSPLIKTYSTRYDGYYARPIVGGVKTQGLHGYNAVDLATYFGAPIYAAADGVVIISRTSGYNAGYGQYIVIQHGNGTQTLYAHMSANLVSAGDIVVQGQQIGKIGLTGKTTGPHVHFEVRGAVNPF